MGLESLNKEMLAFAVKKDSAGLTQPSAQDFGDAHSVMSFAEDNEDYEDGSPSKRKGPPKHWKNRRPGKDRNSSLSRRGKIEAGEGEIVYRRGARYRGQVQNSKRHGMGVFLWPSGDKWAGHWHKGLPHGIGRASHAYGGEYVGELMLGDRQGFGQYKYTTLPDEPFQEYIGEWKENDMDGWGIRVSKDGSIYIGQWQKGQRHGVGVLRTKRSNIESLQQEKLAAFRVTLQDGLWEHDEFTGEAASFDLDAEDDLNADYDLLGDDGESDEGSTITGSTTRRTKTQTTSGSTLFKKFNPFTQKKEPKAFLEFERIMETVKLPSILSAALYSDVDELVTAVEEAKGVIEIAKVTADRITTQFEKRALGF